MCLPLSFDENMAAVGRLRSENEGLLSKAKPIKDLVVKFQGIVEGVNNYNDGVIYTPNGEYLGNSPPRYELGHQSHLEIFLKMYDPSKQVLRRLRFEGNSTVARNDSITAGIFLGEKAKLNPIFSLDDYPESKDLVFTEKGGFKMTFNYVWIPRDFNEEENALYIRMFDGKGYALRTDFSVDYDPKKHS